MILKKDVHEKNKELDKGGFLKYFWRHAKLSRIQLKNLKIKKLRPLKKLYTSKRSGPGFFTRAGLANWAEKLLSLIIFLVIFNNKKTKTIKYQRSELLPVLLLVKSLFLCLRSVLAEIQRNSISTEWSERQSLLLFVVDLHELFNRIPGHFCLQKHEFVEFGVICDEPSSWLFKLRDFVVNVFVAL